MSVHDKRMSTIVHSLGVSGTISSSILSEVASTPRLLSNAASPAHRMAGSPLGGH